MSEFIVGARGHDFGRHSVEELLSSIGDAGFRCTQLAYTKAVEGVKSYADVTPELVAATNAAVQKSGVSSPWTAPTSSWAMRTRTSAALR